MKEKEKEKENNMEILKNNENNFKEEIKSNNELLRNNKVIKEEVNSLNKKNNE